ncbi:hypothetical protein HYT52_04085 [Candidatus Woesearchaeota archaeon]|nr:hypothetical protein [Candidatus Woesearchaeota archaeon]
MDNLKELLIANKKTVILVGVLILLGILGGIALFGVIGVLIGPLILALTIVLLEIFLGNEVEKGS